ncbi:MAG: hypothetical protein LBV12_06920 [Puniceicoccales bacterium]|nr:hypothetical protein [Puniceicoccales bacterium]
MANKTLFSTIASLVARPADTINEAGGKAYALSPQQALAQYALTGCLNGTFYAEAEVQLARVIDLCSQVDDTFIARLAVYARHEGGMKDMPALLCAILSTRDTRLFNWVARSVLNSSRLIRTFVQIMRSGAVGRKSLGTRPKKVIIDWLNRLDDDTLFRQSIGADPSLGDIIKMVHPTPATPAREALYAYFTDRPHKAEVLPTLVRDFEAFKLSPQTVSLPDVPFQMLTSFPLGAKQWADIARRASWQTLRMNLNTLARNGVFSLPGMSATIASRLRDANAIRAARVFPYQMLSAARHVDTAVPQEVQRVLEDAMEISVDNVPAIAGDVVICVDVSGSMESSITGYRKGATSKIRCVDVAALIAAAVLRKNPQAHVIPFADDVVSVSLRTGATVLENTNRLAAALGGGTNCSAPLTRLNAQRAKADLIIYVSDNQSWVDARSTHCTATMQEWTKFKSRNRRARMVCINLQPYGTAQATGSADILNIGGFSDHVFQMIADFAQGQDGGDSLIKRIEAIEL